MVQAHNLYKEQDPADFSLQGDSIYDDEGRQARLLRVDSTQDTEAFQRLRYEYFVQRKRWVSVDHSKPLLETDRYDDFAYHLGVWHDDTLVAYMRLLDATSPFGFMLHHEFRHLLPVGVLPETANSVEVSRLVIAPCTRHRMSASLRDAELLFKLFYRVAIQYQWRHLYAVVEPQWLPRFKRRFLLSLLPMGSPHLYPCGTQAVAAQARLSDLENCLANLNPQKLTWYQR